MHCPAPAPASHAAGRRRRVGPALSTALAALAALTALATPPARAGMGWQGPPALLAYATETPQLESWAYAASSFHGSRRQSDCTSAWSFWECRERLDAHLWNPVNQVEASASDSRVVQAARPDGAFGPGLDFDHATSRSRARSDFGANLAESHAWNAHYWTERRVQSAWDPTVVEMTGHSEARTGARSVWADVLVPSADGQITLVFELRQHLGSHWYQYQPPPGTHTRMEGWASGYLDVQVFDLDQIVEYSLVDMNPVEGPLIVADGSLGPEDAGVASVDTLTLVLDVTAGTRYSLVSRLSTGAANNASIDFYGTAELQQIWVTPGLSLLSYSGTAYNVSVVPEPGTWALMLAGLCLLGRRVRRFTLTTAA